MAKYVFFAGKDNLSRCEWIGYINSFIDRGILEWNVRKGSVVKPEHIDLWFGEDKKIKQELNKMNLHEGYFIIRVEIKDESSLKKEVSKFCSRYGLEYRIYDGGFM